jgi:hypothetical protein
MTLLIEYLNKLFFYLNIYHFQNLFMCNELSFMIELSSDFAFLKYEMS